MIRITVSTKRRPAEYRRAPMVADAVFQLAVLIGLILFLVFAKSHG